MKIQLDLPADIDTKVAIYKAKNRLKTKAEAMIKMLRAFKG